MNSLKLFSDSSCDTPKTLLEQYDITCIPFYVSFDQEHYFKEIEEISIDDFYEKLTSEPIFPKTSLPSVQDYIDHFNVALKNGQDVICICLTSVFSGSYQSACTAKDILIENYPNANIAIVNSMQATGCQGLILLQAAYMKEAGYSFNQIITRLNEIIPTSRVMFTIGTLEYLQKGGRIGKVASLAGSILNLKPMIQLKDGELFPVGTVRGRNKSIERVITMIKEHFDKNNESYDSYDFCLLHGTYLDDAEKLKIALENLIDRFISYPIFKVGVTIGTNTGPDPVGVCFIRKYDT